MEQWESSYRQVPSQTDSIIQACMASAVLSGALCPDWEGHLQKCPGRLRASFNSSSCPVACKFFNVYAKSWISTSALNQILAQENSSLGNTGTGSSTKQIHFRNRHLSKRVSKSQDADLQQLRAPAVPFKLLFKVKDGEKCWKECLIEMIYLN